MMNCAIRGMTLVELMVALVLSSTLMLGVGGAYLAINQTVREVQDLENAQEVLRSSQLLLGRSIRSADAIAVVAAELQVQRLNRQETDLDCLGALQTTAFTETYRFHGGELQCQINGGDWVTLLTGLQALDFTDLGGDMLRVRVAPAGLPPHFPRADLNSDGELLPYVRLDLALKTRILVRET
ncbi:MULTISPECIES: PilW family protein [Alkalimonas]|uniref:Prepilin-type N-terminal cleavage/methylation domain-containing protein n=1 Tax=Alkalimonas mucilaginosa TaxID=3057676 RepID=A0ABU7JG79_9GAMM|nr:prepilin-type N-terminal cleavage/methylation domain-containing protein [Alkalimonas sp. MEB004]MEE2024660.1 prepilin-type N-terminal cleavage/methylation domain-containing protein [Alkalimonas sp. MEB004]